MHSENELSNIIIGEAIYVHKKLGPGLLESVYESCLYYRLVRAGRNVAKEKAIPVVFDEIKLECGYRADMVVENKTLVEVKGS